MNFSHVEMIRIADYMTVEIYLFMCFMFMTCCTSYCVVTQRSMECKYVGMYMYVCMCEQ